ncbi:choice-of-anchor P family protein [Streptomyces sp. NBC_00996]|uniref:choice-of-anchor P family protein n=1 Tax=Streptomyces sp. NBC_00996 TaxID=2903710 RepID=UPI003870A9BB
MASDTSAQLKLQYATGRACGISAHLVSLGLPLLDVEPQPDTGILRTADATTADTPCSAEYSSPLLSVQKLCPKVTTTLAPGKGTASSTVAQARIGLPGVPLIEVSGLTATSSSECATATGSTTLTLKIAGVPVTVSGDPNTELPLVGGGRRFSMAADTGRSWTVKDASAEQVELGPAEPMRLRRLSVSHAPRTGRSSMSC